MHPPLLWKFINKGLLAILGAIVLATIASLIFLSYTLLKLNSLITSSSQNIGTVMALQDLFINLEDAESAYRGYVITGDTSYLKPYDSALHDIPVLLKEIRTNDHLALTDGQFKNLTSLTNQKVAIMKQTVAARAAGGEEDARLIINNTVGKQLMEDIRTEVDSISSRSQADIGQRQHHAQLNLQAALSVAGLLSLFVLGICIVLVWYFQRVILHERALESTKNEFLSLASHQLRTPATNVKQYIGLLLDGYLGDMTKAQRDALEVAYKNNESEINIMNDLLDVAKLDLKRIQLRKQRLNIVSPIKQVIKEYKPYVLEHNQKLTLTAPPELMASVDRTYFKGVIENLVDNAVKYSRDNTRISIKLQGDADRNQFEVVVKDHGLGIQKREASKLFMKFTRLSNEFSASSEGSGMGLYWVKQILELHGGSIKVVSQEGRGSKFTVRLPIR